VDFPLIFSFRGGGRENVVDATRVEPMVRQLVDDLCDEQFARPDYEHGDVYISHPNGWSVSAGMNGEVSLSYWPMGVVPNLYQYGLSKDELIRLFDMLAKNRMDEIKSMKWHDQPVCGEGDHYLFRNRPDMSDLHRAAAKGDCEWIRSELADHADINARDRDGATPLHLAAIAGNVEACRLLIDQGAELDCKDINGSSVGDYAQHANEYLDSIQTGRLKEMLRGGSSAS
jgi:hypothetical protein